MERTRVWAMCAGGHQARGSDVGRGTWLRHEDSDGEVGVVVTRTDAMVDPYWKYRGDDADDRFIRWSKVWRDASGAPWVVLSGKAYSIDDELVIV